MKINIAKTLTLLESLNNRANRASTDQLISKAIGFCASCMFAIIAIGISAAFVLGTPVFDTVVIVFMVAQLALVVTGVLAAFGCLAYFAYRVNQA